jgi:hypothetical protein
MKLRLKDEQKDARAVGVMPADRDWNDVVDLELDGSEAAGEKEC